MSNINCVFLSGKLYGWGIHNMPNVGSVVGEGIFEIPPKASHSNRVFLNTPNRIPVKAYGNKAKDPILSIAGIKLVILGYLKEDVIKKPTGERYSKTYLVIDRYFSMDETYFLSGDPLDCPGFFCYPEEMYSKRDTRDVRDMRDNEEVPSDE